MTYIETLTNRLKKILLEVNLANNVAIKNGSEIPSVFILAYERLDTQEIEYTKFALDTEDDTAKKASKIALEMTLKQSKEEIKPILLISILNAWYVQKDIKEVKEVHDIKVSEDPDKKSCLVLACEFNDRLITIMKKEESEELIETVDTYDSNENYGEFQFILKRLK